MSWSSLNGYDYLSPIKFKKYSNLHGVNFLVCYFIDYYNFCVLRNSLPQRQRMRSVLENFTLWQKKWVLVLLNDCNYVIVWSSVKFMLLTQNFIRYYCIKVYFNLRFANLLVGALANKRAPPPPPTIPEKVSWVPFISAKGHGGQRVGGGEGGLLGGREGGASPACQWVTR